MTTQLQPGDPAPAFDLPDADGNHVSLADFAGRRVIIYFYPAAMTPGCTTQANDFRDSLPELGEAGVAVLGISPDPIGRLAQFRDQQALTFSLLSDADKSVMNAYGAYGEKQLYGRTVIGVIRSTFVVDGDGKIEKAMYNVKATGHVKKLRTELSI
jgi:peroxiredoxin Q/BCP